MIRKAIFPGCYLQGKGIIGNFGNIRGLKDKRVFILSTNKAVDRLFRKTSHSGKVFAKSNMRNSAVLAPGMRSTG